MNKEVKQLILDDFNERFFMELESYEDIDIFLGDEASECILPIERKAFFDYWSHEMSKDVMTKKEIAKNQIELQLKMQSAGFNIVTCGSCGTILIHEVGDEHINCFCGLKMALCDCPDFWYEGLELSEEFKD